MLENSKFKEKSNIEKILENYLSLKAIKRNEVDERLLKLVDNTLEEYIQYVSTR